MRTHNSFSQFIDFISTRPQLYVRGGKRYSTLFGAIISVISVVTMLVLSLFFMFYFIRNTEIYILFTEENNQAPLTLSMKGKPLFFFIQDIRGNLQDNRAVVVTPQLWKLNNTLFSYETLETEQCSEKNYEINEDSNYNETINPSKLSMQTCLKKKDIELNVDTVNRTATYINIFIGRCINNTKLNNNTCYPPEKIDEYLAKSNLNLGLILPSVSIDHNNVKYPVKDAVFTDKIRIYPSMYYTFIEKMESVKYKSDNGLVFNSIEETQKFKRSSKSNIAIAPGGTPSVVPGTFAVVRLMIQPDVINSYKRSFPKLQGLAADIGGMIKFIMFIANILSNYISSQMMEVYLSSSFGDDNNCSPSNVLPISSNLVNSLHFNNNSNKNIREANNNHMPSNFQKNKFTTNNNENNINPNTLFKNPPNQPIVVSMPQPKNEIKTKSKKLDFWEAVCLNCCLKKNSIKHSLDPIRSVLAWRLGLEQPMRFYSDIDNLKYVLLEEEHIKAFKFMKNQTLESELKRIEKEIAENEEFNADNVPTDTIGKKIMERI